MIKNFEDLEVWQEAHHLTLEIYKLTKSFPEDEKYGLISQLRRSAASIAANISEGHGRNTTKEFINFLFNARGSMTETEYHLILSKDLNYLKINDFKNIIERYKVLGKRINALINSLRNKNNC